MARTKGAGAKSGSKSRSSKPRSKSGTKRKSTTWGRKKGRSVTVFTPLKMSGKVKSCTFPQGTAQTLDGAMAQAYTKYARQMYAVMARFRNLDRCLILQHGPGYTGANLTRAQAQALADLRLAAKDIEHEYGQTCARNNFKFNWNDRTDQNRLALVEADKQDFEELSRRYGTDAIEDKLRDVTNDGRFDPSSWSCRFGGPFRGGSPFADMAFDEGFSGDLGDYGGDEGFYGDVY